MIEDFVIRPGGDLGYVVVRVNGQDCTPYKEWTITGKTEIEKATLGEAVGYIINAATGGEGGQGE